MKIKDEWRLAARRNAYGPFEAAVPADDDQFVIDRAIEAVALLIAAEVIEIVDNVIFDAEPDDGYPELMRAIRREVPKRLGIGGE